ncbi:amino acid ABC transporter permease [Xanthobacter tagetidis]|uniref:Amino acid ABC transporter permease n=1 Tax=Xanthobacter tagetidis TaxID=60216 RepID=A0A3L7AE15_9HYPH|nr:amino acid ABC transporter permease [Xanthobacter tagetidis]MBB6308592.1 polar amino acid transport system permease protein [Xanthobacter tagetidis]RLP78643.1 amino acid ABC transporter permease [Xanthobacter tagetidis]
MSFLDVLSVIWSGFGVTAEVTLLSLAYGVPFALIFGILQFTTQGWCRHAATIVIEFWRSSPVIILLFVFYYALPLAGLTLQAMSVAALVLGLNIGGYGSQAVRAALQSLDRGQYEAGMAMGLTRIQTLMLIELPQALKAMVPTFVNLLIQLVKGTALVSLITLADMTYKAKSVAQMTFDPASAYMGLLLSYFIICYPLTILGRSLERRLAVAKEGGHV